MAAGRCSSDPTDLLLVDPSQPEATKWTRKHLTKRQKDTFIQYGFSKALLREVIAAGWDQVDINNYVLYYNSQVETKLAMPAPGLDMSMKRAINTIIRTKLQEEQEEEIGLITPVNPKGPSTGEPPEPDPGMLPPGPEENHRKRKQTSLEPRTKNGIPEGNSRRAKENHSKEKGRRACSTSSKGSQSSKEKQCEGSKRRGEETS